MTTTTATTTTRRRRGRGRMNHDNRFMVMVVVMMIGLIMTNNNQVQAQQPANLEGWSDAYRTEYSYDALHSNGPDKWDSVKAPETGWGEWEAVRLTAGAATFDNNNQPNNNAATSSTTLLTWDASTANQCGSETRPSPIELLPSATCSDSEEIKPRQFNSQLDCRHPLELSTPQEDATAPWELTPYSLRYYLPRTDRTCRRPTLRLDGVTANLGGNNKDEIEEHFVLLWLELHARSEHVINGKRYDAELQMVHMGTTRPDELLIVSVLIDASQQGVEDNLEFQRYLLDGWQRKAMLEADTCQRKRTLVSEGGEQDGRRHLRGDLRQTSGYMAALQEYWQAHNATMTAAMIEDDALEKEERRKLQGNKNKCEPDAYGNGCQVYGIGPRRRVFPYNLWPGIWYFSYEGSLTAPPCTGKVHWRIMDTPLTVSRRQFKQMTHLLTQSRNDDCEKDTATDLQGENFRPLQTAVMSDAQIDNNKQGGKNDNDDDDDGGPQVVAHCTASDFSALVYESGAQ